MVPNRFLIVIRSISFYRRAVFYQVLITALLSAVITGSLLTGTSVRMSIKKSASERLGNTGIMVSSGVRYFDTALADRMKVTTGINCSGLLEIRGYCQDLNSQKNAFNTHIYAVNSDFFAFNGNDSVVIKPGEVLINKRLADYLEVKPGDDLIVRFDAISDIPADAPFAPGKETGMSVVMKVGTFPESSYTADFSLSISQIMPMNIFMNLSEISKITGKAAKINRLLIENKAGLTADVILTTLKNTLIPSDIGLHLRRINKTGEYEIVSDRVFIDKEIVDEIRTVLPSSAPLITYLGNSFRIGNRSTPYSFISALPSSIYPDILSENNIVINRWLANDLSVTDGDSIEVEWYAPDSLNKLIVSSNKFIVRRIVDMSGIWADSLLMPEFPGISGSESCSDWDAGVPVNMNDIRRKDEEYWNRFKGTPKAFISYQKGMELWGNNFGPATSLRFPKGISDRDIEEKLKGSLEPDKSGFIVTDIAGESVKAANESVDFSSLFLSLGFFLILASIVLLSFAVTSYFDSKREQVNMFFALGFNSKWIGNLLLLESSLIALIGAFIGAFTGYFVNILITGALNSVWKGAVQTDTLRAFFNTVPISTGFVATVITVMVILFVKIKRYLKKLNKKEKDTHVSPSYRNNLILLALSSFLTVLLFLLSHFYPDQEISMSFASGTLFLVSLVLFWRQYYIGNAGLKRSSITKRGGLSRIYYSFYPSHAVTPILFIAAGVFAVFITGANRMNFDRMHLSRSSGTGGYLLWCESTIPLRDDLNTPAGKKNSGLDGEELKAISFVQAKRSQGNDASCLNLNHITVPPLLGIDPGDFISKDAFSFARVIHDENRGNPWHYLEIEPVANTIYGIADQTVLDWGLKIKTGDTLKLRAENGQPLNIIIAAGLKSSVFQGYVLIGMNNFSRYYPSVSGTSVLLADGDADLTDSYKNILGERLEPFGITIEHTDDRLAAFYEVTNTYLSVFGVFGALGMIIGVAGLGFVLLRNYNHRKREFALLLATGFMLKRIRRLILSEQMVILFAGVTSGAFSAAVATLPSLTNNPDIPWAFLFLMIGGVIITGIFVLAVSVRVVSNDSLTMSLKKE
jgi:putative ABC transport system permease protein